MEMNTYKNLFFDLLDDGRDKCTLDFLHDALDLVCLRVRMNHTRALLSCGMEVVAFVVVAVEEGFS